MSNPDPMLYKPRLWGKHCRRLGCDDFNEQNPLCFCTCAACKPPTAHGAVSAEQACAALRGALEGIVTRATDTSDPLPAPLGNRRQSMIAMAMNALAENDLGANYIPVADALRVFDAALDTCEG